MFGPFITGRNFLSCSEKIKCLQESESIFACCRLNWVSRIAFERSNPPGQRGESTPSSSVLWKKSWTWFWPKLQLTFHCSLRHPSQDHGGLSGRRSNLGKHEDIKLNQEESAMQLPQCPLGNIVKNGKCFLRMISTVLGAHWLQGF